MVTEVVARGRTVSVDMLRIYSKTFEAARAELEPHFPGQFIDMSHDDFVKDPWQTIDEIYSSRGTPLTPEGRAAMSRWLEANPKGKHGKHSYRLEDYGIDRAEVEKLFGDYVERYDLSME